MSRYSLAADVVLIIHAGFIAFVVAGLVLIWIGWLCGWSWTRNIIFRALHLAAIAFVVLESWCNWSCFLTDWENNLRIKGGEDPYGATGCIAYWLHRMIFFDAPPWLFTLAYTAFGLLVVGTLILAPPKRAQTQPSDPTTIHDP